MKRVLELVTDIRERHPSITDRNVIGHVDIAFKEGHRVDPGPVFPWKFLAQNGHGLWPSVDEASFDNPETLAKLGDCGDKVLQLRADMVEYGYGLDSKTNICFDMDLGYAVRAFNFHFHQSKGSKWGEWDEASEAVLQDVLTQVRPSSSLITLEVN